MLCNSPRAIGPAETVTPPSSASCPVQTLVQKENFRTNSTKSRAKAGLIQRMSRVFTMFRYLLFFGTAFYLTLLLGGEDRGQQRMGLRGAYDVAAAPAMPAPEPETVSATQTVAATPSDTLRILPAPGDAVVQQASMSDETTEPAFNDFNNPTVTLRYITADAANVRDAASRNGVVIGRVERGEIVQLVEEAGDWMRIRIEGDGVDGYVHRRLISNDAPTLSTLTLFPAAD
jgi:hypothetical protein